MVLLSAGVTRSCNVCNECSLHRLTNSMSFFYTLQICDFLALGATKVSVHSQRVNYAVKDYQWVGYDDVESVTEKVSHPEDSLESDTFENGTYVLRSEYVRTYNLNTFIIHRYECIIDIIIQTVK